MSACPPVIMSLASATAACHAEKTCAITLPYATADSNSCEQCCWPTRQRWHRRAN